MKSKRNLITALVGLAMLATPITAAAKDHRDNYTRASQAHTFSAPVRSRVGTVNEYRGLGAVAHRDWHEDHHGWDRGYGYGYGRPGYYATPAYVAPYYAGPVYGGGGYGYGGGGSCAHARQIVTTYQRDRYTGHPAAAADVLRQNQWAFRSGCGGGVAPYAGGLFSGFGGAPAYTNYGGYNRGYNTGYNQPYGGGYGQPYGGGYGQPYGGSSMLTPLLQQFIH